jgi:choice-of-anchor B domain-containing protein
LAVRAFSIGRLFRAAALHCVALSSILACGRVDAADLTFNISWVGESNPFPPVSSTTWSYAEVWGVGDYAYLGSDRSGRGIAIFNIADPANPQYITQYAGTEMEDVEVYKIGTRTIGFFGSDVSPPTSGTGVDIVDLSNPSAPTMLSRVNGTDGGHNKVHTLSVSGNHLYTVDNNIGSYSAADFVKIFDVSDPENPQFVNSLPVTTPTGDLIASHEVVALGDRIYVASKGSSSSTDGWVHIFDVSNPASPFLLKAFESGARTHTVWPTDDGNTIIVAEERLDGNVKIYDVSMINEANDPNTPVLLKTLNGKTGASDVNINNVPVDSYTPHHPFVKGNLLFLSWYEAGLQVFNITDPANPVHVGAFDTRVGGYNSALGAEHGDWGVYPMLGLDRVLLGDRDRGLIIVDATGVLSPGDYDQNGIVDTRDFTTWRAAVGTTSKAADGNKNGIVDAADYVIWRKHLGQTLPPGLSGSGSGVGVSTVPEPATSALASAFICLLAMRRKHLRRRLQPVSAR